MTKKAPQKDYHIPWESFATMQGHQIPSIQNSHLLPTISANQRTLPATFISTICDCPWENLYKRSMNAFAFEQLKTKEKMQVHSKKNEPCVCLRSCSHLGVFACVYCRTHCVLFERSSAFVAKAEVCSKRMQ